jgi:ammonia channel protein AmtB
MMSVPGLALFYGGPRAHQEHALGADPGFRDRLPRRLIWVIYGYSLAFTNGGGLNDFVGGFSKAFSARRRRELERRAPSRTASSSRNTSISASR